MHERTSFSRTDRRNPGTPARSKNWLRAVAVTVALAGLTVAAGCGGGGSQHHASSTLHLAFSFDPGTLDPDVFYGSEGLNITSSCYEGLLRYKDNSTEIEKALA